ncbi:hypothetical protein ACFYNZ_22795 [Streptomyces kebangsaanensis]|uniref:Uncharacterized protein n=1 Tax=Streptomyces kebangsaanensis TaxID=864058 RepID=A0ABW6KWJ2_9ACTN
MRATRHISREQGDADSAPGAPGGHSTTSGGRPAARTGVRPGGEEAGYEDTIAGGGSRPGDEERP